MQHKTKKIWLIALLSLLIAALFAASFTYARYYKETGVTGGKYDDTIEFVGANKYIVYTPEELVAAIENGYSYIEIADGAEEPFVITDGVTDVTANLVLDINGHSLVRNSRNPLIDVQENVSVVIVYDSKASGSFYNPVGSLLQASGGTLTIATGNFTSGPKAEDYVTDVGTTGEGVSYSLENYTVYYRDGYTPGATSPNRSAEYIDTGVEAYLPKIVPVVIDPEAEDRYGNIYFENGIGDNDYIKDDTFLIYTEETVETPEDATVVDFSPLCDVASCDFYYYYEKSTEGSGEDKTTTYAVVYGYHDVMKGAEQQITEGGFNDGETLIDADTAVIWPYAAVRMTEGEAFIRGGTYTNQFGKAQSYGIYARGGDLAISGSSTSFSAIEDGVCVRCEKTTVDSTTYVPQLNISGTPQFFSVNNETIQVEDGDIAVSSGTATVKAKNSTGIYINGGNLEVASTAALDVTAEITERSTGTSTGAIYHSPDGVVVQGGSLESNGTLNVTFTGLENDESGDYLSQQIKSYAVRVEQAASGSATQVTIVKGKIINQVKYAEDGKEIGGGGGVYVGGGTVTLGDENTKAGPTVTTTGKLLYASVKAETSGWGPWQETTYSWDGWKHAVGTSWPYMLNKSGGHAVEVSGGSLTVHGGSYSAQQGNGILIRNTSGSQIPNQVTINSGSFIGYNSGYYISYNNEYDETPLGGDRMVGPAASYGLNVMGHDLTVTINGGSFGETGETGNSAASFFGTSGGVKADVNVYGGTFNATNADAISIFRYIDIMFDGTAISSNIGGTADVASLSVQDDLLYTNDPDRGSTITLENGTFTGTAYGVWYACGYDRLSISGNATIKGVVGVQVASAPKTEKGIYISGGTIEGSTDGIYYGSRAAVNDGLVITGGQIKGTNRYGFYFNQNPWSDENGVATNNVAITGGTFIGGSSAFWANTNDDRGQNAAEQIKTTDIFKSHTSEQIGWCYDDEDRVIAYRRGSYPYTYYHVGGDNSISLNGLMSASAGINSFYLNNFKTIIIKNVKVTDQDVLEDNWDIHRKIYS